MTAQQPNPAFIPAGDEFPNADVEAAASQWPPRRGGTTAAEPLDDEALARLYRGAACECNPQLLADNATPPNALHLPRRRPAAYLGAAVVLVLLAFALAGCGGGEEDEPAGHDKTLQPLDCTHHPELCR